MSAEHDCAGWDSCPNPAPRLAPTLSAAERLLGEWQRGEIPVDVVLGHIAARVAEAVEQERAEHAITKDQLRHMVESWDSERRAIDELAEERDARLALVAKVEALTVDGMTDAGDCCSDYCVADVHDLRLDQAERLEEVLRALLPADDTTTDQD